MADRIPPVGYADIPTDWTTVLQTAVKLALARLRSQEVLLNEPDVPGAAPAQGAAYVQADVQAIADQANANTAAINMILAALREKPVQG
jgi:hypothetical protein